MSLSDCVKCWDTPCTCGWNYRNYSVKSLEKMKNIFERIIEFKKQHPSADLSVVTKDDKAFMKFMP